MAILSTFADLRTRIKHEANINDTSEDALILELTNEFLSTLCGMDQYKHDFRFEKRVTITNAVKEEITNLVIDELKEVIYESNGANPEGRWEISHLSDVPAIPAPTLDNLSYYPSQYQLIPKSNTTASSRNWELIFYPYESGDPGATILLNGTGFIYISADADIIPCKSCYSALSAMILQRLQVKRNVNSAAMQVMDGIINREIVPAIQSGTVVTSNDNAK